MSEKQEEKRPLTNAELDEIHQSLCRDGGGEAAMRGEPMYFEGRPVYPFWVKPPVERHGSFRGVIQEETPRVLDGSKWVNAPKEDWSLD